MDEEKEITRTLDNCGRILIPSNYRWLMGLNYKDKVAVKLKIIDGQYHLILGKANEK